jgi:hypothetical protein
MTLKPQRLLFTPIRTMLTYYHDRHIVFQDGKHTVFQSTEDIKYDISLVYKYYAGKLLLIWATFYDWV